MGEEESGGGPGALVIGHDYGALGVIRGLGRHGIPVWLLSDAVSNASVSRYVRRRFHWPASRSEEEQVAFLLKLQKRYRLDGWAIFPVTDESAALIARHHETLAERFVLTTQPWESFRWAYDKRLTYELAARLGVAHPRTRTPQSRDDLLADDWQFPVIIKPAIKPKSNRLTAAKAWRVDDMESLLRAYDEACGLVDPTTIMVQELIPGGGQEQYSFVALCEAGEPIVWGTARRARQLPLDFGKYSTFVETVDHPPVVEPSRRLLAAMNYDGVVEIEYKRDPRDGVDKLLDINGRYWAWHTLGRRAGADFPYLQWLSARGEALAPATLANGVRWTRMLTDLLAFASAMRVGMMGPLDLLLSYRPPLERAIFALDDPLPVVADLPLMLWRGWHERRARLAAELATTGQEVVGHA